MQTPSIIITEKSISVFFIGEIPRTIRDDHFNFNKIKEAIKVKDWDMVLALSNTEGSVRDYVSTNGKVEVINGAVYYNNQLLAGLITSRIIAFMKEELPFEPLLRFLDNMMQNPSYRARQELYQFLENQGLPITEDGYFLAYKAVASDYKDMWSGKFANNIGNIVKMNRPDVDDDCNNGCSSGLHVGNLEYVKGYGNHSSQFIVCKVNPRDVVSVPKEDHRKLRCCEYQVISQFENELEKPCYDANGEDFYDCDGEDCDAEDCENEDCNC